jgi:hypothetical protein
MLACLALIVRFHSGRSAGGALASRSAAWHSALQTLGSTPLCSIGIVMAFLTAQRVWCGVASASTPSLRSSLANASRQFWGLVRFGATPFASAPPWNTETATYVLPR